MTPVDYRDQTTLITGASSGIGAEFARRLAGRGSHLVLVARREQRLRQLSGELAATYGVRVTPIPLDLSQPAAGERLADEVASRELTVTSLVNNAAFGTFGPFHQEDPGRLRDEIAVDVAAVVDISRAFIDRLRAGGTGVLVNVASLAGFQPSPNMAVYAATKAFVLHFTEALWHENRGTGLRVLALSPGATETEFFEVLGTHAADGGMRRQSVTAVVTTALRALDRRNPPPSVVSGTVNRIAANGHRLLGRRQTVNLSGRITRYEATAEAGGGGPDRVAARGGQLPA
ncbi:SDR family NAD(P)-dependent oxidoreductase [Solwaraspora sp. WMMB335]|uniref:SDR family NAD(P)-dependent oxidoreductase n=1 Tax=Solwaraspora sp. WMMB335 TaxID=3404118 RepID=UPI003B925245